MRSLLRWSEQRTTTQSAPCLIALTMFIRHSICRRHSMYTFGEESQNSYASRIVNGQPLMMRCMKSFAIPQEYWKEALSEIRNASTLRRKSSGTYDPKKM